MDGQTILIIDADAPTRNFLKTALGGAQLNVLTASSGKEGFITALRDKPGMIVFDPYLDDFPGIQLVSKIRSDRRAAGIELIALAPRPDPALANQLTEAGCNHFLIKSADTVNQIVKIASTFSEEDTSVGIRTRKEGGLLIAFLSAKGGTGTSSLCANVAQNIAVRQPELGVVVVDMVLPIGSIAPIVGYDDPTNIVSVASKPETETTPEFFRTSLPYMEKWNFHLLAGAPDPEAANKLKVERIPGIVKALKNSHDIVFVDMGRTLSRISMPIIEDADAVVVVVGADLSTIMLTQKMSQFLKDKGLDSRNVYMILNRNVGLEGLGKPDAERLIGYQIQATMPYMGTNFTLANNAHLPVLKRFPNETAAMMLAQIANQIADLARLSRA